MKASFLLLATILLATAANAQTMRDIGPAPSGDPPVVAQRVILDNFEKSDCPLVIKASRVGDGSIKAFCTNGESYRVFSLKGKSLALKCSVALKAGVAGC